MAASACASAPAAEKTIEPTATEDTAFVLSRNPTAPVKQVEKPPVHVGDMWWPFRADFLKTTDDKARDRDNDISEKQAPAGFWDLQTSVETISIWTTFCNECHGGRRKMEDVVRMPTPTATWGRGEGLFVVWEERLCVSDARLAREAVEGADLGADLLRRVSVGWYRGALPAQPVSAREPGTPVTPVG